MGCVSGPLTVCRSKVSGFYFTPRLGFFSPFPHGTLHYRSPRVFSLTLWSARIPPRFRVSRGTRETTRKTGRFSSTGLSPSVAQISIVLQLTADFVTSCELGRAHKVFPRHHTRNGCRLDTAI